ncbi:hypothetical protein [Maribacter ulvicola]|uniref:Uncharacterized protein n=1 Tax=Maribacter ulvicola TaxID=228959 RepID=A0A1N6V8Y6_9FLAO|nr:hypothetical protein [Maribacter ulvicola]SIQ74351.1 hypothetical protein SAMN05421797_10339 [Maribacter ulvicola]
MEDLKERRRLSYEGLIYSIQRIDLLTISISGAGTYVCLETIKYLRDNEMATSCLVKISGILFVLAICFNFVSQIYGRKSNEQDYLMCDTEIKAGNKINKKEKIEIKVHDDNAEKYSNYTNNFTIVSVVLMFIGLITLMSFFLFTF